MEFELSIMVIAEESTAMEEKTNHHLYDGLALICSDGDYKLANHAFFEHLGRLRVDEIKLVGGPKNLADPAVPVRQELTVDDMAKLLELHGQSPNYPIFLIWHRHCGAYGYQDSEDLYEKHMLKASEVASQFSRPINLVVSEVIERDHHNKPNIVSYHQYNVKDGTLEKSHLFTYQRT